MKQLEVGASELGVLAHMLHKIEFFAPLTVGQLEKILPYIRLNSYSDGETVFRKGDVGDAFYIVHQGSVQVRLPRLLLLSRTVATLQVGDFFGEMALISADPRSATIVTAEPTQLFTLLSDEFSLVVSENPAALQEMKRISARRKFDTDHSS